MYLPRLGLTLLLALSPLAAVAQELPEEPQLRITPPSHTSVVNHIATDAKGTVLVSGGDDKSIRLWSLRNGAPLGTLAVPVAPGVTGEVAAVALSPDGQRVAASIRKPGADGRYASMILVYERATGAVVKAIDPAGQLIAVLAFSPDGARLAAGAFDGGLTIYATKDWGVEKNDAAYRGEISDLAYAGDGSLAVAVREGTLRVYDASLAVIGDGPAPRRGAPETIAFAPDGKRLVIGYADVPQVDVVASPSLRLLASPDTSGIGNGDVAVAAILADNATVIAAGSLNDAKGRMPVFLWRGKAKRRMKDGAGDTVMDAVALPDGGFALASADGAVAAFGADGRLRFRQERASADMRGKIGADFTVSGDATRVRFGLGPEGRVPWVFDAARLSFAPSPSPGKDLHQADVTSLPVENWSQSEAFSYQGTALPHVAGETAQSLAIAKAEKTFLLGTSLSIRKYSVDGSPVWETPVPDVAWGLNLSDDGRLAVAALGDGTLRWYRASDGAELLSVFVDAMAHRWIAWTPGGYFAASPGGESLMSWQVNHGWERAPDVYPANRFHDRFYRPDVVTRVLTVLDEDEAIRAAGRAAGTPMQEEDVPRLAPPLQDIRAPGTLSSALVRHPAARFPLP